MISDKEIRRVKKVVGKYLTYWTKYLGLGFWSVDVIYKDHLEKVDVPMDCVADWRYLTVIIRVGIMSLYDMSDERIERMVLHELVHPLVNEMRSYLDDHDHEERVVSQLVNAFMWVKESLE
jgi:hypothetical protein